MRVPRVVVRLDVTEVEVAKGHDGLLRGVPEPVVIIAAWVVSERGALLVGRKVARLAPLTRIPASVPPTGTLRIEGVMEAPPESRLLLLASGVEEDTGSGVQEVFAAMERSDILSLLHSHGDHPHGGPLDEFTRSASSALLVPAPLRVQVGEQDLATQVVGDDWIGAAACVLPCAAVKSQALRFPLRADDGRNDWTVCARLTIRG